MDSKVAQGKLRKLAKDFPFLRKVIDELSGKDFRDLKVFRIDLLTLYELGWDDQHENGQRELRIVSKRGEKFLFEWLNYHFVTTRTAADTTDSGPALDEIDEVFYQLNEGDPRNLFDFLDNCDHLADIVGIVQIVVNGNQASIIVHKPPKHHTFAQLLNFIKRGHERDLKHGYHEEPELPSAL